MVLDVVPRRCGQALESNAEADGPIAPLAGVIAAFLGLAGSWYWDSPAGPSILVAAASLFLLSLNFRRPA